MALDIAHKSKKFIACGASGTGKSTLMLKFIREYPADQLFLFDHQGEFCQRIPCKPVRTEAEIRAAVKQHKAVVFDPSRMFPGKTSEAFEWFCKLVWELSQTLDGVKLFVWDESGTVVPLNSARYENHPIRLLAETGRTRRIDMLCSAQQPNHVNNSLRQQITDVFAFRTGDATAAKWFVESKGYDFVLLGSLKDGEFVYKNDRESKFERGAIALGK